MVIVAIIIISIILMALFIGVTIVGGKSHDRNNAIAKQRASDIDDKTSIEDDQING
ncbi:MAG: hypothetical protein V7676_16230 [Parasphingorhabdus sp.]|uniref:hypothetical protein n=1 Tax=Parasphingorhabdus sp. TaxID=2709688 RepID=UPI0030037DF6